VGWGAGGGGGGRGGGAGGGGGGGGGAPPPPKPQNKRVQFTPLPINAGMPALIDLPRKGGGKEKTI
jgi:hypothetical protein